MGQRFFQLTPDVSVQYWMEFVGSNAVLVKDTEWPEKYYVPKDPNRKSASGVPLDETARLYLRAEDVVGGLLFKQFAVELFDFAKIQFRRGNGAQMVHFRPSDENPVLLGFDRLNPRTGRNCHKDFSETFVDRHPGVEFINYKGEKQVWEGFKFVYLKVKPADGRDEYYLKVWTDWQDNEIFVWKELNPPDVPEELRNYEFKTDSVPRLDPVEEVAVNKYRRPPRTGRKF